MANGLELATAYVNLTVSAKDVGPSVRKQFGGIEKDADRTGKRAGKSLSSGLGGAIKGLGPLFAGVAAGFAVGGIISGVKSVVGAASDLQQSVGGVQAVFKDNAPAIEKAAKGAAKSLGLSENAYNELATTLGAGLKNKGIKDYAGETQKLVGIGGDLAAQFGGSTREAVDALASAMRGESDPIEKYGVSLNETAVNAELAAKGQDKLKGAALEQAKAQARVSLIMKQTADAHGAFGRESDTLAGKQARLTATIDNIKTKIGTALLPIMEKVAGFLLEKGVPAFEKIAKGIGDFFGIITNNDTEIDTAVATPMQRFGLVVLKVGHWIKDDFIPAVQSMWGWLKNNLWPALKDAYQTILPAVRKAFDIVTGGNGNGKGGVSGAKEGLKTFGDIITQKVIPFVALLVEKWLPYAAFQLRILIEAVKGAWKAFQSFKNIVVPIISTIVSKFLDLVGAFVNGAAKAFGWMPGIGPKLKTAAKEFNTFRDKVNAALDGIKDKKVSVGVQFIAGSRVVLSGKSSGGGVNKQGGTTKDDFATGGVLPGYTPGRDVHQFYSPSAGYLNLSGGEAIMRPEFTRLVGGKAGVDALNAQARSGSLPFQAFASGGVFARVPSGKGIREGVDSATLDVVAKSAKMLQAAAKAMSGGPGMGWRAMVAWAKANIPSAAITSTLRHNNPASDHDKGRAIDLAGGPGMGRIFDRISGAFPTSSVRSLYYSPKGANQIRFNRRSDTPPHIRSTHFDHVHWAMANGGVIPGRENGGPVLAGRPYVVGEKRPELFVPDQNGTILPGVPGGLDAIALREAMSGLTVVMDGQKVGRLVSAHQQEYAANGPSRR